jgi:transcription-repair coupling factor (superfamily II helicase)
VTEVSLQGNVVRFSPVELPESAQLRLARLYERSHYKPAVSTVSVPRPKDLRDVALLGWCADVLTQVTAQPVPAATPSR